MLDPDDYDYGIASGPRAIVERVPGAIRAAWIGAPFTPFPSQRGSECRFCTHSSRAMRRQS